MPSGEPAEIPNVLPSARRLLVWSLVLGGVLWVFLGYRRLRWQAKELPLVMRRLGGVNALAERLASYRKLYLRQNRDSWLASCAARRMTAEGAAQGAARYREGLTGLADWIGELGDGGALTVFDPGDEWPVGGARVEGGFVFSPDSRHAGWVATESFGGLVRAATLRFDPPGAARARAHGGAETDVFRYRLDLAAAR